MLSTAYDALMHQTFGEALKTARIERGLSQRALAERLQNLGVGLDQAAITRMETGQREPKLGEALQIADFLGIDVNSISYGPDNKLTNAGYLDLIEHTYFQARQALSDYLEAVALSIGSWQPDLTEGAEDPADQFLFPHDFVEFVRSLPGRARELDRNPVILRHEIIGSMHDVEPFVNALLIGLDPDGEQPPQ